MIVEGKKIAEEIYAQIGSELDSKKKHPVLCVLTCAPNAETKINTGKNISNERHEGILPYLNGTNPDVDLGTISITAAPSSHNEDVMVL